VRFRGVPHSANMQIDERLRMLSKDIFEDQSRSRILNI